MFTKNRGDWDFRELRWGMATDAINKISWPVMNEARNNASLTIYRLAEWPSRQAIKKEIGDVC